MRFSENSSYYVKVVNSLHTQFLLCGIDFCRSQKGQINLNQADSIQIVVQRSFTSHDNHHKTHDNKYKIEFKITRQSNWKTVESEMRNQFNLKYNLFKKITTDGICSFLAKIKYLNEIVFVFQAYSNSTHSGCKRLECIRSQLLTTKKQRQDFLPSLFTKNGKPRPGTLGLSVTDVD